MEYQQAYYSLYYIYIILDLREKFKLANFISPMNHPQEVPLAQFSLYVHKGGLKSDSFHLSPMKMPNL